MAPTEGRIAKPERQWGCRCGTPNSITEKTHQLTVFHMFAVI